MWVLELLYNFFTRVAHDRMLLQELSQIYEHFTTKQNIVWGLSILSPHYYEVLLAGWFIHPNKLYTGLSTKKSLQLQKCEFVYIVDW